MAQEMGRETAKRFGFSPSINGLTNEHIADTVGDEDIRTAQVVRYVLDEDIEPASIIGHVRAPEAINGWPDFQLDGCATTKGNRQGSTFRPIMVEEPNVGNQGMRALQSPTSVITQDDSDRTHITQSVKSLQSEPCAGPMAEIYAEIASKLAQPQPNVEIFFVERTGTLVDQTIPTTSIYDSLKRLYEHISGPFYKYENTVEYLSDLGFLSQTCITDLQFLPKRPFFQQDMQAYLNKKGAYDDAYSSEVRIVEVQRNDVHQPSEEWVVKTEPMPEEDSNTQYRHSFRSLLGELLAYELSQRLGLDLVPETRLILLRDIHGIRLGTAKPLMHNLSQEYEGSTGHTWNRKAQLAKAFCFIMGQGDLRLGNISMDANGNPVLIDNECIVHLEPSEVLRVNDFEGLRTSGLFMCISKTKGETSDRGSQDKPIQLDNGQLAELMGQDISDNPWWLSTEDKRCEVIVQGGKIYRCFPTAQTLYMPFCYQDVIAKFDRLDSDFVLEASKGVMDRIDSTLRALEHMCLSTSNKKIPRIDNWLQISSHLEERIQGLAIGVDQRKASFCAFHNNTP